MYDIGNDELISCETDSIKKSIGDISRSLAFVTKAVKAGFWIMPVVRDDILNPDNKVIWSDNFRILLGIKEKPEFPDLLASWLAIIHPDDKEQTRQALINHITDPSGNTPLDIEQQLRLKNNKYGWFRTLGTTLRRETGQPVCFFGTLFNIHDQKMKQQEMEFMLTRFDLISRALTEGPWDMSVIAGDPINPQNEFWWSPQVRKILGYKNERDFPNLLSSWSDRLHPEDREKTLKALFDHLNDYSGRTPYSIDYRLCLKNGEYRWFHATGATMRDERGVPLRVAGTIRDIEYERKQLRESQEKLDRYCKIVNALTKKEQDVNLTFISAPMKSLVKSIEKYAKVDAPVLINGESGVGKEVVADLIHNFSDRQNSPFLKINCGAIPETLLESELFGYERGAFSGAKKEGEIGLFELADNGTVLLDEIGDLPFSLQVKLLRFIQEREFYKVGGKKLIKVNTRIIAATNRDLENMIRNKEFRADLFYRLQVLTINIPALRERPDDIVPLTKYFLKKYNDKYGTNKVFAQEVYGIFTEYSWPGNVRELENLTERLVVNADTDLITAEHIPESMKKSAALVYEPLNIIMTQLLTYKEAKERFERQYFARVIQTFGSTRKVAEKIRLDHSTIVKKAAKYGINLLHWQKD